jgi:hypothetical protein
VRPRKAAKPKTKVRSKARARAPPVVEDEEEGDDDDDNDDDDGAGSLPFILKRSESVPASSSKASGHQTSRFQGGMLIVDEIREEGLAQTDEQFAEAHQPPWSYSLHPAEIGVVRDWTEKRATANRRLKEDKLHTFVRKYAVFTRRLPSQLIAPAQGQRRPQQFQGGWLADRNRSMQQQRARPSLVEGGVVFGGAGGTPVRGPPSAEKPVFSPIPGSPVAMRMRSLSPVPGLGPPPPPPPLPPPPPPPDLADGPDLPELPSAEEQRILAERERQNSERLYAATSWVNEPPALGMQDVSDDAETYAEEAFSILKRENRNMSHLDNFYPLIFTDVTEITTLFADLAAMQYASHAFIFPTRNTYQAMHDWILERSEALVDFLSEFEWDTWKNDFKHHSGPPSVRRRGIFDGDVGARDRGLIAAVPTPAQLLSDY